ncbi:MAG: uracil-DNA glycosylase [Desulfobacter sp.]|nr:MAG: uracil-DNA glycosylase [Desulfobacter sp.]
MAAHTRINCYKCKFFYVTWEPAHPNGCRAMGFKSKQLPSVVVRRSSGKPCQLFEPKKQIRPTP